MLIVGPELTQLVQQCAPLAEVATIAAIIRVESRGNPLALLDNGPAHLPYSVRKQMLRSHSPATKEEAVALAKSLIAKGHLVDAGIMQINNRNYDRYGLTVESVFDPCANVAAGSKLLHSNYVSAVQQHGPGQKALAAALSAYNTGSFYRGVEYVRKIYAAASGGKVDIALAGAPRTTRTSSKGQAPTPPVRLDRPNPYSANPEVHIAWN